MFSTHSHQGSEKGPDPQRVANIVALHGAIQQQPLIFFFPALFRIFLGDHQPNPGFPPGCNADCNAWALEIATDPPLAEASKTLDIFLAANMIMRKTWIRYKAHISPGHRKAVELFINFCTGSMEPGVDHTDTIAQLCKPEYQEKVFSIQSRINFAVKEHQKKKEKGETDEKEYKANFAGPDYDGTLGSWELLNKAQLHFLGKVRDFLDWCKEQCKSKAPFQPFTSVKILSTDQEIVDAIKNFLTETKKKNLSIFKQEQDQEENKIVLPVIVEHVKKLVIISGTKGKWEDDDEANQDARQPDSRDTYLPVFVGGEAPQGGCMYFDPAGTSGMGLYIPREEKHRHLLNLPTGSDGVRNVLAEIPVKVEKKYREMLKKHSDQVKEKEAVTPDEGKKHAKPFGH